MAKKTVKAEDSDDKTPPLSPEKQARMDLIVDLLGSPAIRTQLRADLFAGVVDSAKAVELQGASPAMSRFDFQNGCRTSVKLLDSFEKFVALSKESRFEFAFVPYVSADELAGHQANLARAVTDLGLPDGKLLDLIEASTKAATAEQAPVSIAAVISLTRAILNERPLAAIAPIAIAPPPLQPSQTVAAKPAFVLQTIEINQPAPLSLPFIRIEPARAVTAPPPAQPQATSTAEPVRVLAKIEIHAPLPLGLPFAMFEPARTTIERPLEPIVSCRDAEVSESLAVAAMNQPVPVAETLPEPVRFLDKRLADVPAMQLMPELLEACTAQSVIVGTDLMKRLAVIKNPITNVAVGIPNARKQTKDFLAGNILVAPSKSSVTLTTVRIAQEFDIPIRRMLSRFDFPESVFEKLPVATNHESRPLSELKVLHYLMPEVEHGLAASKNIMTVRQTETAIVELGEVSAKASRYLASMLVDGEIFLPGSTMVPRRCAERLFEAAGVSTEIACRRLIGKTPDQIVAEADRVAATNTVPGELVRASGARPSLVAPSLERRG